jgi:hypothetical protein
MRRSTGHVLEYFPSGNYTHKITELAVMSGLHPHSHCHFAWQPSGANLTNITALQNLWRDCSCYVSRPKLPPPPLWPQKHTDLHAHKFAPSPDLRHQPRLANVTCTRSRSLCGINSAIPNKFISEDRLLGLLFSFHQMWFFERGVVEIIKWNNNWRWNNSCKINPLTPELNPSAQRCLTRFLLGICFLNRAFH